VSRSLVSELATTAERARELEIRDALYVLESRAPGATLAGGELELEYWPEVHDAYAGRSMNVGLDLPE